MRFCIVWMRINRKQITNLSNVIELKKGHSSQQENDITKYIKQYIYTFIKTKKKKIK